MMVGSCTDPGTISNMGSDAYICTRAMTMVADTSQKDRLRKKREEKERAVEQRGRELPKLESTCRVSVYVFEIL